MKGHAEVIDLLNELLTNELTAINQYFIHAKLCANWGYKKLAAKVRAESIDEMKHADEVIGRILLLGGVPNMQRMSPVRVGEDPIEQHKLDLAIEYDARDRLNRGIAKCREKGDEGTRVLLDRILADEEGGIDWLEAQLELIRQIGEQLYLAQQIRD